MTISISIVMGSFNQKDTLKRVLDAYHTQSFKGEFEVIVVDSSSTDGTQEMLKSYEAPFHFKPIIQDNDGKAAARNRGVHEAQANTIIITDSDMIPHRNFVREHVEAHANCSEPCCFEGTTMNMKDYKWPPDPGTLTPYITRNLRDGAKLGWYYFLTGNISFPKSVFESENGFDETFKSYGWEDLELGYRLSLKKVPLYYLKDAINYHYHVISREDEIVRCKAKGESAALFVRKHPKLSLFLGLNPVSKFVFPRISQGGWLYRLIEQKCFKSSNRTLHEFGFWFLKEHYYLQGLLPALRN